MKIKAIHNRKEKTDTLTVKTTKGEKLEYAQAELLHQGTIDSFLPFSYEEEKDGVLFSYDTTDLVQMKTYLKAKLSLNQFHSLLNDVITVVECCGNNNLLYTNMLFELDRVFLDPEKNKVRFAYIPASGMKEARSTISDFLRLVATQVTFICEEDRMHAHDLIDFLQRQTVFSLVDFESYIDRGQMKRREDIGLEAISTEEPERNESKGFDFLKTQANSVSSREVRANQTLAEQISFDVADTPSEPTNGNASSIASFPPPASSNVVSHPSAAHQESGDLSSGPLIETPLISGPLTPEPPTSEPTLAEPFNSEQSSSGPLDSESAIFRPLTSGPLTSGPLTPSSPIAEVPSSYAPPTYAPPAYAPPVSTQSAYTPPVGSPVMQAPAGNPVSVPAQPYYLVRHSNMQRTLLPVGRDVSVGRSSRCDIPIKGNTNISREHARFRVEGDRCFIVDLNSTNKCYVSGNALNGGATAEITRGSTIKLADELFTIE